MPLRVIRELLTDDPERAARLIELEDRILERAIEARETRPDLAGAGARDLRRPRQRSRPARGARRADARTPAATTPTTSRSSRRSPASAPAATRRRIGFTVYDTLRYREALDAAGRGGGPRAARPAGRRRSRSTARSRSSPGRRAAARSDRRDALEAAAGRAAPPARVAARPGSSWVRARSPPDVVLLHHAVALGQLRAAPGSWPAKVPNGWR